MKQTDVVIIENNCMKMHEFCDKLLKIAEVIPEDKVSETEIRIYGSDYDEVWVWLEY